MVRFARTHRLVPVIAGVLVALRTIAPATILCVGTDGHLAIEEALTRCCDPAQIHGHGGAELAEVGGCGDHCTDTPVGVQATHRDPDPTAPVPSVLVSTPVLSGGNLSVARLSDRLVAPSPPLAPPRALRTTVDLC